MAKRVDCFVLNSKIVFDSSDFNDLMFLLGRLEILMNSEVDTLMQVDLTEASEIDKILGHLCLLQAVRSKLQSDFYANHEIIDLRLN